MEENELRKQRDELLKVLKGFVNDFESDYVLHGIIVDNPSEMLKANYTASVKAINNTK